ncbi:MAG: 6-phosphogluconolactonase [Candidatus Roseilinea sp.]|nr:MAG: 6-phosphogluconolactonase [Candidatus Roseilinea sp.]
MASPTCYAFVGTYTNGRREGIFAFRFDTERGTAQSLGATEGLSNPSFLAIHPSRRFLYAVSEVGDFGGKPAGAVSAFVIEAHTGALRMLNQQSSVGSGPCHLSVDATGRWVLVANYGSGSVAVLPIHADGSLAEAGDFVQHHGASINPQRQEGPHAHSVILDPANRFAFVADLGLDRVMIYRFDAERGKLTPNEPAFAPVKPGAGPRHFTFHPGGRFAYVINELDNTVTAFAYDAERGALRALQTISTLPEGYAQTSYGADVHIAPSGRFLYGSNRGHDSIAIFAIADDGRLSPRGQAPTHGRWPRNFALDPTGRFMWIANQESNAVTLCAVDEATGQLSRRDQFHVPKPVCVKFVVAGG